MVLWDVDHTLIETRGVGLAIYRRAFPAATGRPLDRLAVVSGRTELDIMRETLRLNDHSERSELVAIAQLRASQRTGTTFNNDTTVLIGDTPNDVAAA